ncbi:MAG: hypothetical protein K2I30_04000 [Clostridia bacterium]|nr:hypothetical protein [Clostridia bacterium]
MDICKMAAEYGLDTLLIAALTVIFTGIVKIPIKRLAQKTENGKKFTKFITLIPIVSGFGITALVSFVLTKDVKLGQEFFRQWLSAVSLSLAIYAFWEKFVPSKKAALSGEELEESKGILERIKIAVEALPFLRAEDTALPADGEAATTDNAEEAQSADSGKPQADGAEEQHRKIVLKSKNN